MMCLKCSSVKPIPINPNTSARTLRLTHLEVACLGKDTKRKRITVAEVKMVTGDEMELTNCLKASITPPPLSYAVKRRKDSLEANPKFTEFQMRGWGHIL